AVVEMGTNHPGEVAALVDIARPTIGLITNAGAEHLEGFGSLEGVARAEGEMVAGLAEGSTAVINADDEFAPLWRSLTSARVLTFGVRAASGRLQFRRAASGAWLIDDSYNANPSSVRAAIEVLAGLAGRKWLVLGDMAELGEFAEAAHRDVGEFARAHGVQRLYATGAL